MCITRTRFSSNLRLSFQTRAIRNITHVPYYKSEKLLCGIHFFGSKFGSGAEFLYEKLPTACPFIKC